MKCLLVVAAATFMSCSSDSGATAPVQVATFADLGECNAYSEGVTKQVAADSLYYKCVAGGWQETEWVPDNSGTLAGNVLFDSRDGHTYKIVTIGSQTWMAENLMYKVGETLCSQDTYCQSNDCFVGDSAGAVSPKYNTCYYKWETALSACPAGWHLPSIEEWKILAEAVGGIEVAGKMLKSSSGCDDDYRRDGNGIDAYGFSVVPTGSCSRETCERAEKSDGNLNRTCLDGAYVPSCHDGCSLMHGDAVFWSSTKIGEGTYNKGGWSDAPTNYAATASFHWGASWESAEPLGDNMHIAEDKDVLEITFSYLHPIRCVKD